MLTGIEATIGAVMMSKGIKIGEPAMLQMAKFGTSSSNGEKMSSSTETKGLSEGWESGCTHYGNMKHTCETCFKLHGYLEWWNELKAQKQREAIGGSRWATLVNLEPYLSLVSQFEFKNELTTTLSN